MKTWIFTLALLLAQFGQLHANELTINPSNNRHGVFKLEPSNAQHKFDFSTFGGLLILDIRTETTAPEITLTSPDGTVFTNADFSDRFVAQQDAVPLAAVLTEAGKHQSFELETSAYGQWQLLLTLPQGQSMMLGNISVINQGDVGIAAYSSRSVYNTRSAIVLGTALTKGETMVLGAQVNANVYDQDLNLVHSITLLDEGTFGDSSKDDGLYSNVINNLPVGSYTLKSEATVNGAVLVSTSEFEVTDYFGRLTGSYSERGIDLNNDNLFEQLELTVNMELAQSGLYGLALTLVGNNNKIPLGKRFNATAGFSDVKLTIDTQQIKAMMDSQLRFDIENVLLMRLDENNPDKSWPVAHIKALGQTATYHRSQLQRGNIQISPIVAQRVVDTNDNGLYDQLIVTVELDVMSFDYYSLGVALVSADGQTITNSAHRDIHQKGKHLIELSFDGTHIGQSAVDGPFTLENLGVYGQFFGSTLRLEDLDATEYYDYLDFEGADISFAALYQKVDGLLITGIGGAPKAHGIRKSLLKKVEHAQSQYEKGQTQVAINQLNAMLNEVDAQTGKHIVERFAVSLTRLTHKLIEKL